MNVIIIFFVILFLLFLCDDYNSVKDYSHNCVEDHSHDSTNYSFHSDDNTYVTFDSAHKSKQKKTLFPRSLNDIVDIVKNNQHVKIRTSGGHHTFNTISFSNEIMLRMTCLKKVLDLNLSKSQITVESGTSIKEINEYLKKYKLALSILPAIPWQSIAGALATSSHGSNINKGSMSSMIVDMTIVLSNGSVKKFTNKDKEFKALIVGLGCLGVVYSVTLQCVPAFTIKHVTKMMTLDKFKEEINDVEIIKKYPYIQGYIYPELKGDNVKVYYREIVNEINENKLPIKMKTDDSIKLSPKYKSHKDQKRIDWSDNILTNNQEAGSYTEAEIAVNVKDWENSIDDVIKLYFEHKKNNNYISSWPLLVRFTMSDDSLIGMTSGINSVFIDAFNSSSKTKDKNLDNYFKDFENLLINKYKGRPHYGKRNYLDSGKMKKIYGQNVVEFNKIRKLMDPVGMFSNDYINNLLGNI